jgi:D-sedoheptulose 7-phosphate isomerase
LIEARKTDPLLALVRKYPELVVCQDDIQSAFEMMKASFENGGKLLVCGNGGSAADSEHIVGELMKGYLSKRPVAEGIRTCLVEASPENGDSLADHLQGALPAISLVSHTALITAYANDVAADMIFAQQVFGYGRAGDALLALSTSGNARNVLNALQVAQALGLKTLGLTGRSGGALVKACDVAIRVPWDATPDIQERHLPVIHTLCEMLEAAFF